MNNYQTACHVIDKGPKEIPDALKLEKIGNLFAFNDQERNQFNAILRLIVMYIEQKSPKRPLCIGVFGPPGSGKSFSVAEIVSQAVQQANDGKNEDKKISMPSRTFNLTQIPSTRELSELLGQSMAVDDKAVPVLFFDEFDAPLNGSPLGWLHWFLAPMHDGHFQLRGTTIPLRRAVYVFAGGTSPNFRDFVRRNDAEFKNAKGPDFVSRLRGVLDIVGINERSTRYLRRALILWNALKDRRVALWGDDSRKTLTITENLKEAFLKAGRFRYGARSIGAVVEMCEVHQNQNSSDIQSFTLKDLPEPYLLEIHVDRGPLDFREIGGGIGLSAGADKELQGIYEKAWKMVANALWEQGATIVYGGNADEGGFTDLLQKEIPNLPCGLLHPRASHSPPYFRWIDISGKARVSDALKPYAIVEHVPELVKPGRKDLQSRIELVNDPEVQGWLTKSLCMHRLRRQMNDQCVARVVIGGKLSGYSGRFPGVLEETLLAIRTGKPVYVIGGFGGAAAFVGELLGLGTAEAVEAMKDPFDNSEILPQNLRDLGEQALKDLSDLFCGEDGLTLPLNFGEAVDLLWKHALDGPNWVNNGLSRTENQRLFKSKDSEEICDILIQGIVRATVGNS